MNNFGAIDEKILKKFSELKKKSAPIRAVFRPKIILTGNGLFVDTLKPNNKETSHQSFHLFFFIIVLLVELKPILLVHHMDRRRDSFGDSHRGSSSVFPTCGNRLVHVVLPLLIRGHSVEVYLVESSV